MARTSARVSLPEPEVEGEERRRVVRLRLDVRESRRARRSRSPCTRAISRSVKA